MLFLRIRFIARAGAGALLAAVFLTGRLEAGIIQASSLSRSNVVAAIAQAQDGDTVALPAGTADWKQPLVISKAITLQGLTTVAGGYAKWALNPLTIPSIGRRTVIRDAISPATSSGLIQITHPTGVCRITGITFLPISDATTGSIIISPKSGSGIFRVDHCEFDGVLNEIIWAWSEQGLIDHNVALNMKQIFFHHKPVDWGGAGTTRLGDGSWAWLLEPGGERAVYLEDNYIKPTGTRGATDGESGARFVFRYNVCFSTSCQNHGAEASYNRSGRKFEVYKNLFILEPGKTKAAATFWRGGSGFVWGNVATGNYVSWCKFVNYRDQRNNSWCASNGLNEWDQNDPHGIWFSGTAATASTVAAGISSVTVTGASWAPNQWRHYSLMHPAGNGEAAPISGNSGNSLQFASAASPNNLTFAPGDPVIIRKVFHSVDHCGAGVSDDLRSLSAAQRHVGRNIHQTREPVYVWNNTINGTRSDASSAYNIVENLDYYNEKTSFDGTVGLGRGTISQRPSTCSPGTDPATGGHVLGVGYWATDQGEWDSTHDGPDGQLYVATATNTWSPYYKPYVYPHPLTTGAPPPKYSSDAGSERSGDREKPGKMTRRDQKNGGD